MLFVATTINYVDRQVLSILAPILAWDGASFAAADSRLAHHRAHSQPERSAVRQHCVGVSSCLRAGRDFCGTPDRSAWMPARLCHCDRVWSLSAMGHSLVNTVRELGLARFTLGLGESGNFPAAVKATAEWFPPKERALATGIFNSGTCVGAIVAPVMVPWVVLHFGWRASFLVTGFFSATWIVWWSLRYRTPRTPTDISRGCRGGAACQQGRSRGSCSVFARHGPL